MCSVIVLLVLTLLSSPYSYIHNSQLLSESELSQTALQATNEALREASQSTHRRLESTLSALQVANNNANTARADADAAEATAAQLATTLQDLQTVVNETKRACQVMHQEHEHVASAAGLAEQEWKRQQAELQRVQTDYKTAKDKLAALQTAQQEWTSERLELLDTIARHQHDYASLQRQHDDHVALAAARADRMQQLQSDSRQAQALLAAATAGQQQSEQTRVTLEQAVEKLRQELAQQDQLWKHQQTQHESSLQRLQTQHETAVEQLRSVRLELDTATAQVSEWKEEQVAKTKELEDWKQRARMAERRVKELQVSSGSSSTLNKSPFVVLPPLPKKTPSPSDTTKSCCLCGGSATMGIIKPCPCGCGLRAHFSCMTLQATPLPSVSHPGTPAPRKAVLLCELVETSVLSSSTVQKKKKGQSEEQPPSPKMLETCSTPSSATSTTPQAVKTPTVSSSTVTTPQAPKTPKVSNASTTPQASETTTLQATPEVSNATSTPQATNTDDQDLLTSFSMHTPDEDVVSPARADDSNSCPPGTVVDTPTPLDES